MIIFLDFDGVLHPRSAAGRYFVQLPLLETVLREFLKVDVVVTSTWRESKSLEELREVFSDDLRSRVVGTTPILPIDYPPGPTGIREKEIREYLAQHGQPDRLWCALDDEAPLFSENCSNLILCNTRTGLDDETIARLRNRILDSII